MASPVSPQSATPHFWDGQIDFTGKLIKKYRFLRELGKGGSGSSVYLAEEIMNNRPTGAILAVKVWVADFQDRISFQRKTQNFARDF